MHMNQYPEQQIEEQVASKKNDGYGSAAAFLFDILEMAAWSIFVMVILLTFAFRVCRVEGSSMENTLYEGQTLLIHNVAYTPKQDDIVVFHLAESKSEKILVKRVIATEGQTVRIDYDAGEIYVDGVLYEDSHRTLKTHNNQETGKYYATGTYAAVVPEGRLFVMGDNRNNSRDSRDLSIGFVDERCVLGKVVLRLSPFTFFF